MNQEGNFPLVFGQPRPDVVYRDRVAAYAIIHNVGRDVAVIRFHVVSRARDYFWLPGGGMLNGETPQQTIRREVREELGREVCVGHEIGTAIQYFYAADKDCSYKMTAHFFIAAFQGITAGRGEFDLEWTDLQAPQTHFFHECHGWAAEFAFEEK